MTARMGPCGALLLALALVPAQLACEGGGGGGGTPAAIVVANPRGGEAFAVGAKVNIEWQLNQEVPLVDIDVSRDGGLTWQPLVADWDATTGSYDWTVDQPVSTKCHVRVSDTEDETRSAKTRLPFEIAEPYLNVVSPNGGEEWAKGITRNIRWVQCGVENVRIELSRNGAGGPWVDIVASVAAGTNPGAYEWQVTDGGQALPQSNCLVRISDADAGPLSDTSNAAFAIVLPSVTVLTPNGGETCDILSTLDITWDSEGVDEVRIDICHDGVGPPAGWTWTTIAGPIPALTGSYSWTVIPGDVGLPQTQCYVRVVNVADEGINDVSNGPFTIPWDNVYRVKLTGDNTDGRSWVTAFQHPQTAAAIAGSGQDIWVAAGTYTDHDFNGTVLNMFVDNNIYGGFSGDWFGGRIPAMYVTVLDGQGSARVVRGAGNSLLDGFRVTGGSTAGNGAGMRNISSGVAIANCVFTSNVSGMFGDGGGIYNSSEVTITSCSFISNASGSYGGGIYNSSTATITDCSFTSNTADRGGGVYNTGTLTCTGCGFNGNVSTDTVLWRGGGGLADADGTVDLSKCRFTSNQAYEGGGFCLDGTAGLVVNCLFWGNQASNRGGGIYADYGATCQFTNCTVAGNTAWGVGGGGGVFDYVDMGVGTSHTNVIVWGNTGTPNFRTSSTFFPCSVDYSCIQASASYYFGSGNTGANPDFVNEAANDYHLQDSSPCRDAGTPAGAPADDLDGQARVGNPDMGCYEYP